MIKKVIYFLVISLVLVGTYFILSKPPTDGSSYENPDLVFYWGEGCPHCETVKNWLSENNQQNILKINSKEVYKNQNNSTELFNIVNQYCPEIKGDNGIGVPAAFDPVGKKCYQGSDQIIKFLGDKLTK
jgi:hypothetical protein